MPFNLKAGWFQDTLFLAIAALVVLIYVVPTGGGFPLDDSWIHQTYARNLATTGQWAFILGVPSAASTSPLYTILLAIGYKFGVDYVFWTHLLGILALTAAGMIGARMAERLLPQLRFTGFITGLTLIFTWHLIWAAASGMETMLFCAMTLVLIWLSWRELDPRSNKTRHILVRGVIFGCCAALTVLTRPEGILLAGLIGLAMLLVRPQSSWDSLFWWSVGAAIGFVILISPYLWLNLQLTGGLLPNTAAAKQAEYASFLQSSYPYRLRTMIEPIIAGGQVLLLPALFYFLFFMMRRYRGSTLFYLMPLVWAGGLIGLYAARLPAFYQHGRYLIPALPSLVILGTVGAVEIVAQWHSHTLTRIISRTLAISTVVAFLFFAFSIGMNQYRIDVNIIEEEMVAAAKWVAKNVSPNELLAVHDIGAVGYFASRPILDLAGLVNPEVIPLFHQPEALWELLHLRDARYLMAFPDQIPGRDTGDSRLCLVFMSDGATSVRAGGPNMAVYRIVWDGNCIQGY